MLPEPEPVLVAVLDTGYVPHPDLTGNLDAASGYDFIRDLNAAGDGDGIDPDATDPGTDASWHGTKIAGAIAAHTDNGMGVAGLGWPWGRSRVTIMPVRVVGLGRAATTYDVAQGLLQAPDQACCCQECTKTRERNRFSIVSSRRWIAVATSYLCSYTTV